MAPSRLSTFLFNCQTWDYCSWMHKWQSCHNHVFNHISYTALGLDFKSLIF
ncbi:hypothetical protein BDW60DRAFT_187455 [Aspergillus nidulans var. acristatus]